MNEGDINDIYILNHDAISLTFNDLFILASR